MFKMTRLELDLISDIDMHLFIEKEMRGDISYIAKRHSKANNKLINTHSIMIVMKKVNTLFILM